MYRRSSQCDSPCGGSETVARRTIARCSSGSVRIAGKVQQILPAISVETAVDPSAGSFRYVENGQVCCWPIELEGENDEAGVLMSITAARAG